MQEVLQHRRLCRCQGRPKRVKLRLLPSQQLTILPSTHHVHDHPQISVALTRAAKAATGVSAAGAPTALPFLDAGCLAHSLKHGSLGVGELLIRWKRCERLKRDLEACTQCESTRLLHAAVLPATGDAMVG